MRRRGLISLIILVFVIGLTACGRNYPSDVNGPVGKAEKEKTETVNEHIDEDKETALGDVAADTGSKDYATLLEEGFGIGFIPHGCDAQFFVPATEDYIIVVEKTEVRENSSPAIFQTGTLYSFDETGKLVQWVKRVRPRHEYEEMTESEKNSPGSDYTDYSQENIDGYNDSAFGGKFDVITDLFIRKENNPELAFYMSKPLTTSQTKTSFGADPAEIGFSGFKELVLQTRVGED